MDRHFNFNNQRDIPDGRVSIVWGTHTHVPTADEEILPGGTAYLGDIGMTGPYNSVIGLEVPSAVKRFVTGRPAAYKLGDGNVQIRAVLIDVDDKSGKATSIERLTIKP